MVGMVSMMVYGGVRMCMECCTVVYGVWWCTVVYGVLYGGVRSVVGGCREGSVGVLCMEGRVMQRRSVCMGDSSLLA